MIFFLIAILVFVDNSFSQDWGIRDFILYPSTITQSEPVVTINPNDRNFIFSSANTIKFTPFFISEGIYISTNSGLTWAGTDTCYGEYINFHGGDPAIVITKNNRLILTRLGRSPFIGLYTHFSTDNGKTWSFQKQITDHDLDRASLASDIFPTSPYYGRTYAAWVRFAPPYPVFFSYSDDGGSTWSVPKQVNNPPQRNAGVDIAIDKNGNVYLVWALVSASSPFTEQFIGFAKSTNGGNSWRVTERAFPILGIQGLLTSKQNIRVNSYPRIAIDTTNSSYQGSIYIVTTVRNLSPAGNDPDIILYRSTDGGTTWQNGIRVNQDPLNNGKIQFFPAITVDTAGGINIIYYDDRNTTSDSTGVFLSRSTNGGNIFIDYPLSTKNFRPMAIGGLGQGYQGDLISVINTGNILIPIWMDNRTGIYQLWTARIEIDKLTNINYIAPTSYQLKLEQNYPNPFNSKTEIQFEIPSPAHVQLEVFNILGQPIIKLIDKELNAGKHSIEFNGDNLKSGIYFYRLKCGNKFLTKKMIHVK